MISYREATIDDAASIAQTEVESKRASIPEVVSEIEMDYDWSFNRWTGYINKTTSPGSALDPRIIYLACDKETVVGYAACHHTTKQGIEAELQSIYVLKEYQGQGIGSALLKRIVEWLLADGKKSLLAGFYDKNSYVAFYKKLRENLANGPCIWYDLQELNETLKHILTDDR